ncbi:hypothetical protein YC2023_040371 [Brassica napus]
MVSITHKDDQIVESKEITPISSPKNTYETNSDELNDTDEEEVNVCDTCGVQGFTNKLAICDKCGVVEIELEEMRAAHVVSIGSAALRSLTPYCEAGYVFTLALMSAKIDGVSHGYLQNVDVIVTPTTGYLLIIEIVDFFSAYLMRFVVAANLLGFPAISVPVGYDKEGLPIGLQIMGRPWELAPVTKKPAVFHDMLNTNRVHTDLAEK